jgi:uncharacterized protein VirK/YbjX
MAIGVLETLIRIHHLGRAMHPKMNSTGLKHQIILMSRALRFLPDIQQWFMISDNPLLLQALVRFPLMHGMIYWPYINHTWPMARRLSVIDQHYRMLGGSAKIIADATFEEVVLAQLEEEFSGLRLVLDKASWFLREGEIVLNLFVNEQRLYSIAFTLGINSCGPIVFVGALQGSNSESAQEIYRDITHALHGMRPRDLLMVSLKLLCSELGINRIWAISSDNRQHNSPYFGNSHKEKVLVAYNEIWQEHGGIAIENGFYEIPVTVRYRDVSEIPTRKRATYRRRYHMLDKLGMDIKNSCALHATKSL